MKKLILVCMATLTLGLLASCNGEKSTGAHTLVVTTDGNGTAVVEPARGADAGAIVTLTATPNDGFVFDRWEVVNGNVADFRFYNNPSTFFMPDNNVEIKAYFGLPDEVSPSVQMNGVTWATLDVDTFGKFAPAGTPGKFYQYNRKTAWSNSGSPVSFPAGGTWEESPYDVEGLKWEPENDPCPTGWRMPTYAESQALGDIDKVKRSWVGGNLTFTDDSNKNTLAFYLGGQRLSSGMANEAGNYGKYWLGECASPQNGFHIRFRQGDVSAVEMAWSDRVQMGMNVRCVRK